MMMQLDEQKIKERAYQLWQDAGSPQGADLEHWFKAREEFVMDEFEEPPSPERAEKAMNSRASSPNAVPLSNTEAT